MQTPIEEYPLTKIAISSLKFDQTNPNKPTREQIAAIKKSFERFGFLVPITVNENMEIGDGEHRALIYKELGLQEIPGYIVPKINDDIERRLLRQTMNKLRGEHDIKLDAEEIALIFQNNKLDNLAQLIAQERESLENILTKHKGIEFQHEDGFDVDKALEDLVPETQLGDIWQLGQHRIICADCTDKRSIDRLLEDKKIDLVVTSPPYDDLRSYNENSEFDFEPTAKILYDVLDNGSVVVWIVGDQTEEGDESGSSFRQALGFKDIGFKLHDTMIWNKGAFRYPSEKRYHQVFEYMFILTKGKLKTFNALVDRDNSKAGSMMWSSTRSNATETQISTRQPDKFIEDIGMRFNVWNYGVGNNLSAKDQLAYKHPAIFPIPLVADHIKTWSNEDDAILDPFLGSGSTLIACEQTNRICYGVEIDPHYVDVAVKRWEAYTGKKAEKVLNV